MSFRRLVIALTFLAIFAMALRISTDTDTWWHLRTGELILQSGVPTADTFSFTRAGAAWLYPSAAWVSEVQLYLLHQWAGFAGLNLWVAALVTLTFVFVYKSLSRGGIFLQSGILLLAAASSAVYWAARPYLWSFVFSAVCLWLLEAARAGQPRRLLWLPVVMLAWANSHPGFIVGFILLGLYALERVATWWLERRRKGSRAQAWREWGKYLAPAAGGMLLAVCINPSGPVMLRYPFDTVEMDVLRGYIQEWQSPNFHETRIWPFGLLAALSVLALIFAPRRPALYDLLLVSVLGGMSLLAVRNVALFALAAPIVLSRNIPNSLLRLEKKLRYRRSPTRPQAILHVIMLVLALATVTAKASIVLPAQVNEQHFRASLPVGAVDYLKAQRPQGRIFNSYNWGGYLVWALPEYPVFADGRTDLYGDEVLGEWLRIANAEPGWEQALARHEVKLVLLEPSWPLSKLLPAAGWQLLYEDEITRLFGQSE
ncbi:MAG: hypothetical protein KF698_06195 [Anaerolineales bacterium]|nr:hypothetical protein [Anaerolineales bacterium]